MAAEFTAERVDVAAEFTAFIAEFTAVVSVLVAELAAFVKLFAAFDDKLLVLNIELILCIIKITNRLVSWEFVYKNVQGTMKYLHQSGLHPEPDLDTQFQIPMHLGHLLKCQYLAHTLSQIRQ